MHHSVQRSVFGERNFNVYSSMYQENSSTKVRSDSSVRAICYIFEKLWNWLFCKTGHYSRML